MRKEDILFFEGEHVRLVKLDGFALYGTIVKINDDNVVFETHQATSVIRIDNIREVTLKKEGNNGFRP